MKIFSYSNPNRTPITELTDDQIAALPERFLCVTRTPGTSSYLPVFAVVKKSDLLKDVDECLFIDSYWGYARGRDVYIATRQELDEYEKNKIDTIKKRTSQLRTYLTSTSSLGI